MLATSTTPHLFWITSRAAGDAALILSSLGVCIGLLMGGRFVKRRGLDLRSTHEALSLATLVTIALHAVSLLGDNFLNPTLADLAIPFASHYKTLWMSTGIIAGWMMVLLGLSYYARSAIGPARWRNLHRWTALAWVLGIAHSLGEGTDAGTMWFLAMTAIVTIPPLILLFVRLLSEPAPARQAA